MNRGDCLTGIVNSMDQTLQVLKENDTCRALVPDSKYEKNRNMENLRIHTVSMVYNSYSLQFNYQTRGFLAVVNSILDAGYEFMLRGLPFYIPAIYIVDYLGESVDHCFVYPQITNGDIMKDSVESLFGILKPLENQIGLLAKDEDQLMEIKKTMIADCQATIGYQIVPDNQKEADLLQLNGYCDFLKTRFTTGAFQAYLLGDCVTASKLFGKFKSYTSYEKKLMPLIDHQGAKAVFPDAIRENILYYSNDSKKAGLRGFCATMIGAITIGLLWTILFAAAYLVLVWILGRNQVFVAGALPGAVMTVLPGMIMGVFTTYYVRAPIYRILFRKRYERIMQMDYINNTVSTDRMMHGIIRIAFVVCLLVTMMYSRDNVVFGTNGFWDNSGFWNYRGEYHTYYEIRKAVYEENKDNEVSSYVLYMKDGTSIDLSYYESGSKLEKKVIPLLKENDVTVEK